MTAHALPLLAAISTDWWVGYSIGIVVVVAVVALVAPILVLAHGIGKEAPAINEALEEAVTHTAPLAALSTTIDHAEVIVAGLSRGRTRLGG
jgi:Flp pilus assembly protein TadB